MASGRRGGGFGFVMLIVVMAVILLLVAKSWKNFGSAAIDLNRPGAKEAAAALPPDPPQGTTAPGGAAIQSHVTDAKAKTDAHSQKVQEALGD